MTEQAQEAVKGLPDGVAATDLSQGQGLEGAPLAPVISNTAPKAEPTAEEKAATDKAAEDAAKIAEAEAAAKLAEENKAKEEPEVKVEPATEYVVYGDEAADAVVAVLKDGGITPQEAHEFFAEAAATGDFSKIDVAGLTAKLGKEKANLVALGVKDYYGRINAGTKESVDAVYQEVGGEANWKKVQAWATEKAKTDKAFATQKEELNAMFDLNKTAARNAAAQLKSLYEKDAGNSSLIKTQVHGDSTATDANAKFEPLSRADYLTQVKAAEAKGDHAEVSRLRQQRTFSRKNFN